MNIYLLTQNVNTDYNTWDSCVVIANNEQEARMTHPDYGQLMEYDNWDGISKPFDGWCNAEYVKVELIGTTNKSEREVICSSFNAG